MLATSCRGSASWWAGNAGAPAARLERCERPTRSRGRELPPVTSPTAVERGRSAVCPDLMQSAWADTRDTVQLWTQGCRKVRLALEADGRSLLVPAVVSSPRTDELADAHTNGRSLEADFDFVGYAFHLPTSDGQTRKIPLEPCSVASSSTAMMAAPRRPRPTSRRSCPTPSRSPKKNSAASDAAAARGFGLALLPRQNLKLQNDNVDTTEVRLA